MTETPWMIRRAIENAVNKVLEAHGLPTLPEGMDANEVRRMLEQNWKWDKSNGGTRFISLHGGEQCFTFEDINDEIAHHDDDESKTVDKRSATLELVLDATL